MHTRQLPSGNTCLIFQQAPSLEGVSKGLREKTKHTSLLKWRIFTTTTDVSWKRVLCARQTEMAFHWAFNSPAKLWCSKIPQTLLWKSTSRICLTIWSSQGITALKSLKGVGFKQLCKGWRMSTWRWSQRLAYGVTALSPFCSDQRVFQISRKLLSRSHVLVQLS